MYHGAQFIIEIYNMPSKFAFSGSYNSSYATQYGKINVFYENLDNAGTVTQKSAGSIETDANDISGFGGGTTTYTAKVGLYKFGFSNMGVKTFYNGNGVGAAGGLNLQKGWTLHQSIFTTFQEENNTSYSMQAPANS